MVRMEEEGRMMSEARVSEARRSLYGAYLVRLTIEKAKEKVDRGDTGWTDEEREKIKKKAKEMARATLKRGGETFE